MAQKFRMPGQTSVILIPPVAGEGSKKLDSSAFGLSTGDGLHGRPSTALDYRIKCRMTVLFVTVTVIVIAVTPWVWAAEAVESEEIAAASAASSEEPRTEASAEERERIAKQLQGLVGSLEGMPVPPNMTNATIILPNAEEGEKVNPKDASF